MAFDFDVKATDTDCIYNIEQRKAEKKLRVAKSAL